MSRAAALTLVVLFVLVPFNLSAQGVLSLCDCSSFFLTDSGQVTANPAEVISGSRSIKGSYTGPASFTPYLRSKPSLSLVPLNTYSVTFRYHILVTPDRGFETLIYSPTGGAVGNFLPSVTLTGSAGDSGIRTLTNTLGQYLDYELRWNVVGNGAISIDDIAVVNVTTGQTVASENAELVVSPISNFQPSSTLLAPGSTSVAISFNTSQATNCGYSVGTLVSYGSMKPLESGSPTSVHQGTVTGLSSDTRILNHVYVRCASNPDIAQSEVYRTVAVPAGAFPRIGNIWIGNYVYQTKPDQAQKIQLFLGPNSLNLNDATALRSAEPGVLILPSVNVADNGGEGSPPDDYYLKDVHGNKIADWCGPPRYLLNMTKPEVAKFFAQYASQLLVQSNLAFDGLFFDSFSTTIAQPFPDCFGSQAQIDSNGDGVPDDQATLNAAWRAGEYLLATTFHNLVPNAYVSGHVGETPPDVSSLAGFNGTSIVFDPVNVREGTMAFGTLWNMYQVWEAQAVSPVITMVQSSPPNQFAYGYGYTPLKALPPATAAFAQSFYPNMRFGLALALMSDGFFTHDFGDTGSGSPVAWWYDEYDFKLGFPAGSATPIAQGSATNLLNNGDFEGDLTRWQLIVNNDGQAAAAVNRDNTVAASGSSSAVVTVSSAGTINWHVEFSEPNVPLTGGTNYQLQFWARADSPRAITVHSQGGPPNFPNYGLSTQISIDTSWKQYKTSFVAPTTAGDGRIQFWVGDVPGKVWIDEVELVPGAADVYRRDFTNGVVLLNGTTAPQTVPLEPGLSRFTGTQAPLFQYIVDDSSSSFTSAGSWKSVRYDTGAYSSAGSSANLLSEPQNSNGPYYHAWLGTCRQLDEQSGTAQWDLGITADGEYTIQVWLPAAPNASAWTKNAVYDVVSGGSVIASETLDQSSASSGDQWHTVGKFILTVAGTPFLRVHNGGSGSLIADAVYVTSTALYNDGSLASQVTLAPMDGILLRRQQPVAAQTSRIASVVNSASLQPGITSSGWVSILGIGFTSAAQASSASDFAANQLPTSLGGISVNINGKPAYVAYVDSNQIDAIAPDDNTIGEVQVEVIGPQGAALGATALKQKVAPQFFTETAGGKNYVAAVHSDGAYVTQWNPVIPGEVVSFYGTGLGSTNPAFPSGQIVLQPAQLVLPVTVSIGGVNAEVQWAGLVEPGLYMLNVKVPNASGGDQTVQVSVSGFQSAGSVFVPVGTN